MVEPLSPEVLAEGERPLNAAWATDGNGRQHIDAWNKWCLRYGNSMFLVARDHARLTAALRVVAAATATEEYPFCKWCGFEIGNVSQTPGHARECPSAVARAALAASVEAPTEQ